MIDPSCFKIESVDTFRLSATVTSCIKCFRLSLPASDGFRVIIVDVPGPLCAASIVIPTVSWNNKGLPHTLEHLIFCGSQSIPTRGFLDNLANRSLSTGTNAYTTEDHTCYEITTAGSEGMLEVLPVFLDHILNPTLRERQFQTEVWHLNHEAKYQGVVYCEMASREHSESDLLDLKLRQMLFDNQTTYSFECGGLTTDIVSLSNEDIKKYHQMFYRIDCTTVIVCGGSMDSFKLFSKLCAHPELFYGLQPQDTADVQKTPFVIHKTLLNGTPGSLKSSRVKFPSDDESLGSIGYGWRGPPSNDLNLIVSINVLFRFLHENAASPLAQMFVERPDPYSSQIDFDIKLYFETCFMLVFSGVPYFPNGDESDGSADDKVNPARRDLFGPDVFFNLLRSTIETFVKQGFETNGDGIQKEGGMGPTLKRHRRKIIEALEEEPHEVMNQLLFPDIIRHHAELSNQESSNEKKQPFKIGTHTKIFDVLDKLEAKPNSYWQELAKTHLLDAITCEVQMIPSASLADDLQSSLQREILKRQADLGEAGLLELKQEVEAALKENSVCLTEEMMKNSFPEIPDATKAPSIAYRMENIGLETLFDDVNGHFPFSECQAIETNTSFVSVHFGLNVGHISEDLRLYLPLFQELLFQTGLMLPTTSKKSEKVLMEYTDVVKYTSDLFISHEASVGFGNDIWTASWLSDVFMLSATSEKTDWERMIRFVAQVVMFSDFSVHQGNVDRILSVAKNLVSGISEVKRDGQNMLAAVSTRMYSNIGNGNHRGSRIKHSSHEIESLGGNDAVISIFAQEKILNNVIRLIEQGDATQVTQKLEKLREAILADVVSDRKGPCFVRIAVPRGYRISNRKKSIVPTLSSGIQDESESDESEEEDFSGYFDELVVDCLEVWKSEFDKFQSGSNSTSRGKKRQRSPCHPSCFPYPRKAFNMNMVDESLRPGIIVPIRGIQASFLSQSVPCDVMSEHPHPDYFPVVLLSELISRSEGPLYTATRGPGYAYGASLNVYLWLGQISLDVYDSTEPYKCLIAFYRILETIMLHLEGNNQQEDDICNDFHLGTARASIAFKWVSECSTPGGVISTSLRSSLRGFKSLKEHQEYLRELYKVTRDDLRRVFHKYFAQFLDDSKRVTVVVTSDQQKAEEESDDDDDDDDETVDESDDDKNVLDELIAMFGNAEFDGLTDEEKRGLDFDHLDRYSNKLKIVRLNELNYQ